MLVREVNVEGGAVFRRSSTAQVLENVMDVYKKGASGGAMRFLEKTEPQTLFLLRQLPGFEAAKAEYHGKAVPNEEATQLFSS